MMIPDDFHPEHLRLIDEVLAYERRAAFVAEMPRLSLEEKIARIYELCPPDCPHLQAERKANPSGQAEGQN